MKNPKELNAKEFIARLLHPHSPHPANGENNTSEEVKLALKKFMDSHKVSIDAKKEVLEELLKVQKALSQEKRILKFLESLSEEEDAAIQRIKAMEQKRFELLDSLNGTQWESYASIPLE